MYICISNTSNRIEIEIGKTYEIFEHEHPKCVWVRIPCTITSLGYKTIQAYLADFKSISNIRDEKLNDILKNPLK
jgi:hypothetical protein